jgi:hypothetical protein
MLIFPHGEPRAYVERDWGRDRVRVHLGVKSFDGRMHVVRDDGTVRVYEPDETPTATSDVHAWLSLPEEVARKLLDELAAYFGGMSESRMVVKYLDAERARVDRLIGIVADGRDGAAK